MSSFLFLLNSSPTKSGYISYIQPVGDEIIAWGQYNTYFGILARFDSDATITWNIALSGPWSGLVQSDSGEYAITVVSNEPNGYDLISANSADGVVHYAFSLVRAFINKL